MSQRAIAQSRPNARPEPWTATSHTGAVSRLVGRLRSRRAARRISPPRREGRTDAYLDRNPMDAALLAALPRFAQR